MATNRDWADAYLAQARADLVGAQLVGTNEPSVFAMLMQMVFEKFAKAALLRSGSITMEVASKTHKAASLMMKTMRLQRGLMAPMGGPHVWHRAFEVVDALERANPSEVRRGLRKAGAEADVLARGAAQLEYPWETPAGQVQWPARDLDIVAKLGDPRNNLAAHLSAFASKLDRYFDAIFQ